MSDQASLFGGFDLPAERRGLLLRVHRGQAVEKKALNILMAHGLVYLRTSDYTHRLTPPGREKVGL